MTGSPADEGSRASALRWKAIMTAGLVTLIAGTACQEGSAAPLSPTDAEALVALAPEMTVDALAGELQLEDSQRAEFGDRLQTLHASMLEAHNKVPASTEGMSQEELEALHEELQQAMLHVHEGHQALMETLSEEQRERFMVHVHARMAEHHDAMELEASSHEQHGASHPHELPSHSGTHDR